MDTLAHGIWAATAAKAYIDPKIVICAHHIVPPEIPTTGSVETLRAFYKKYFKKLEGINKFYKNEESLMPLACVLENALNLAKEYPSLILDTPTLEITSTLLQRKSGNPLIVLFRTMMAKG